MKRSDHASKATGPVPILKGALWGVAVCLLSLTLMLLIFSGVCLCFDDPHKFIFPLCLLSIYASALLGGIACSRSGGGRGLLPRGALCGALILLALWGIFTLISLLTHTAPAIGIAPFIYKLMLLPVTLIGALIGGSPSKTGGTRRKRR